MKTIGLIGGMSWESTIPYYRVINETVKRALGGLHSAKLLLASIDFAELEALQRAGDWDGAGQVLAGIARGLEAQGAGVIGLATNTMHICAPQIVAALSVPFVHIAAPTADAPRTTSFSVRDISRPPSPRRICVSLARPSTRPSPPCRCGSILDLPRRTTRANASSSRLSATSGRARS